MVHVGRDELQQRDEEGGVTGGGGGGAEETADVLPRQAAVLRQRHRRQGHERDVTAETNLNHFQLSRATDFIYIKENIYFVIS